MRRNFRKSIALLTMSAFVLASCGGGGGGGGGGGPVTVTPTPTPTPTPTAGCSLSARQDFAKAVESLQRAKQIAGDDSSVDYWLAWAQERRRSLVSS